MGLISALFGSPIDDVEKTLKGFKYATGMSETKFRDALTRHVASSLSGATPKREAGLHGEGTRVDLFFEHGNEEFFCTIKQGLSEQKAKILLGEAVVVAQSLAMLKRTSVANVVVVIMVDDRTRAEAFDGHMKTLMSCLAFITLWTKEISSPIRFHLAFAEPDGTMLLKMD